MGNTSSYSVSDAIGGLIDWTSSDKLARAKQLRDSAIQARTDAAMKADASKSAYQRGEKALAKKLSDEKTELRNAATAYDARAKTLIFQYYNSTRNLNSIDLHGLFVPEATEVLQERIVECKANRVTRLEVITGRGVHSRDGISRLKPMVTAFCDENGVGLEPGSNEGCFVIVLGEQPSSYFDSCVIM
ncbi:hypothetical protein HDU99_004788 [Rhizoclosmatium hyalinum]|nr:hypothetical protein HDU99_004788 [Rhizoclosmatium hyalinum]